MLRAVPSGPSVLVNWAGVDPKAAIDDQSPEEFLRVLQVNLIGPWLGMRAVLPGMRAAAGGSIVNVVSVASYVGTFAPPGLAAYTAPKWALRGLTKAAALELGVDNIRRRAAHISATITLDGLTLQQTSVLVRGVQPSRS